MKFIKIIFFILNNFWVEESMMKQTETQLITMEDTLILINERKYKNDIKKLLNLQ